MENKITLRKLYNLIVSEYPNLEHNQERFQDSILRTLDQDPLRNFELRKSISKDGLEYQIFMEFPINDFLDGSFQYLLDVGLTKKEAGKFKRKYRKEEQILQH